MSELAIAISGVTGLQNRGVEALLVPTLAQLRERLPASLIVVLSQTPEYDAWRLPVEGVVWQRDGFGGLARGFVGSSRRIAGRFVPRLGGSLSAAQNVVAGCDLLIATGGDVFSSDYGDFSSHLQPLDLAIRAKRKTVLLAQSIGPFSTPAEARRFHDTAGRVELITVRESLSYRYCVEELGLSCERVHLAADPGLLLPVAADGAALQRLCGVPAGERYAALAMSCGIARYSKVDNRDHIAAWVSLVESMLAKGLHVLLVPHVQRWTLAEDDRAAATELARALGYPERVHIAAVDATASEFKALIAGADLLVSERMHAAIAGLSCAVPTAVVGYSVKARGILSDIYEELSSNWLIPIGDFIVSGRRNHFLERMHATAREARMHLCGVIETFKARAVTSFTRIADLFA